MPDSTAANKVKPPRQSAPWLRALRVWQWSKNLLVFVPLVTSHRLLDLDALVGAGIAFVSFSLLSSGTYLFNDLRDVEFDRQHPRKKFRPIASGGIPEATARVVALMLGAASVAVALQLPPLFWGILGSYLVLTTSYTLRIKQIPLLDTVLLAGLYSLRLLAGHAAGGIPFSSWLLTFAFFIFLSLALLKRHSELLILTDSGQDEVLGRGYRADDQHLVRALGVGSGLLSVLVLMLYTNSPAVQKLYEQPQVLLLLCPLGICWIGRMWWLAERRLLHDDPVIFTLRDRWSYLLVGLAGLVMVAAK